MSVVLLCAFGVLTYNRRDWYGMTYFSTNVGTLYCVPTFSSTSGVRPFMLPLRRRAGYIFSNMFGVIYDSNIPSTLRHLLARAGVGAGHSHLCPKGLQCYSQVFHYTLLACTTALAISVLLGWRTGRQLDSSVFKRRSSVSAIAH